MPEIALVLGGGGARGLAHVHVLEAFDDLGVKPAVIAGTSIGAVIGAGYAAGIPAAEIRNFALKTLGKGAEVMSRLWRLRPQSFSSAVMGGLPKIGDFNAQKVMRAFLPHQIPETFEELQIPLKLTATEFYTGALKVIETGGLYPAIAASAALPVIFKPEVIDDVVLMDGGLANPVPFDLVMGPGRKVIAVDVVGMPKRRRHEIPTRIDAAYGASQLMMQTIIRLKLEQCRPDVLIVPPVSDFRVMDFLRAEHILKATAEVREETRQALELLLRD
jgi:NTE family protein